MHVVVFPLFLSAGPSWLHSTVNFNGNSTFGDRSIMAERIADFRLTIEDHKTAEHRSIQSAIDNRQWAIN